MYNKIKLSKGGLMKLVSLLVLIFSLSSTAHALIEVRGGYGLTTPSKDFNGASVSTAYGFNADVLVKPPMFPFGLGVRYENLGAKYDVLSGTTNVDMKVTNLGLLINYRIIDMVFYVGPIAFVGVSNSATVNTTLLGVTAESKYKSSMVYSLGAEAGASLGLLSLGAEAGYNFYKYTYDSGTVNSDLDLSGIYAKVIVGFGF